jgi:hypothetical protein
MNCDRYKKHALSRIGEDAFDRHLKSCSFCRMRVQEDARLRDLARSLKRPVAAPWLWSRIAVRLREEKKAKEETRTGHLGKVAPLLRFAAVLVIGVVLTVYFWPKSDTVSSKLLADSALRKVEVRERAYLSAIAELERQAGSKVEAMDIELALLYRDRLEVIDAQIAECREAIARNPANAHIRRYMLAALQDKTETLHEMLRVSGSSESRRS